MINAALAALMPLLFLAAAGAQAAPVGPASPNAPSGGVASWYGSAFQGRRTASGEVYDKERLTAAHRSLPFGTYLRVVNLDNGSSVVVRVNDRGPFVEGRVLDLSEAAARILGMIPSGTARVSFAPVPAEEALAWAGGSLEGAPPPAAYSPLPPGPSADSSPGGRVRIQVASYRVEANALATLERLRAAGLGRAGAGAAAGAETPAGPPAPRIEEAGGAFRVVFADLDMDQARLVAARLDLLGYHGYLVTVSSPVDPR